MNLFFESVKRVVIKLGTGVLTKGIGELDVERIQNYAKQVAKLREHGFDVIIVSSGSIGLGMGKLRLKKRPSDLATLQACASIGQTMLIQTWQKAFDPFGTTVAQILFTRDDLTHRSRHIAAKDTIEKLLSLHAVPIVNENDTVNTEEITFGDNDLLGALVSSLVKAQMLIILSTIDGLIDLDNTKEIVPVVPHITPEIERMAKGTQSATAVGGMRSKVESAKIATATGCGLFICNGADPAILETMISGQAKGTFFVPNKISLASKKRWLAFFEPPKGHVKLDSGASDALLRNKSSLLAAGITEIEGTFPSGSAISIQGPNNELLAKGIVHFSSEELKHIIGKNSKQIALLHPDRTRFEVVHRDAMVLLV